MNPEVVITITAVLGLLFTVAGAFGIWMAMRTARNTQTLQNFRDAAQSWREKAEATASDLAEVREELDDTKTKLAELTTRHVALQDVVTGRAELDALRATMDSARNDIVLEIHVNRSMLQTLVTQAEERRP